MSATKLFVVLVLTILNSVNGNPYPQMSPSFLRPPSTIQPIFITPNVQNRTQIRNKTDLGSGLEELYRWKLISYTPLDNDSIIFGLIDQRINDLTATEILDNYIPYNNFPMGVVHHGNRLFIGLPRRRVGMPATLAFVSTNGSRGSSPSLQAFPDFRTNQLHPQNQRDAQRIISVYRPRVDSCNRLWFVDTGSLEYPNNTIQIQPPSIWIFDMSTDLLIRRFEIPSANVRNDGHGLASITIDIDDNACDDAFAYLPDLVNYRLHVYSFRTNQFWSFSDNAFGYDPIGGNFDVGGVQFQWNDGIFSITLSPRNAEGFKTAYFHAMASTSEFEVSTQVLKNQTLAARTYHNLDFAFVGKRGDLSQSAMHAYDPNTGVILYTQVALNGIACWDTFLPLTEENFHLIHQDDTTLFYPSDITIDSDGIAWVLTNRLPLYNYASLDANQYNYRILRAPVHQLIKGTSCDEQK